MISASSTGVVAATTGGGLATTASDRGRLVILDLLVVDGVHQLVVHLKSVHNNNLKAFVVSERRALPLAGHRVGVQEVGLATVLSA